MFLPASNQLVSLTILPHKILESLKSWSPASILQNIREVISLGKRQKMKLLPFLFSCVYSGVKLFVFAIKRRRRYPIFVWCIYGLEEKNSKAEVIFAVCRLPLTSCLTSRKITSAFEFFYTSNP